MFCDGVMLPWGQLVIIQLAMYSVISHLESVHMVIKWGCEAMKLNCLSYHCYLVVVQQEWQPSFFGAVWFLITDTYLFSGAFTVAAVTLIGQIHISYSYFLPQWYSEAAVVLFIFLLLSVFATCIHLYLHSSINSSSQFARVLLPLLCCLCGGLSILPGAYGDIGVVTLRFMRHVMVCVTGVFTPQYVSTCFLQHKRPSMFEDISLIVAVQELILSHLW